MYRSGTLVTLLTLLTATGMPAATHECVGDCDADGSVAVAELVQCVGISLGSADVSRCPPSDGSGDGNVGIEELVAAVNGALHGCPGEFLTRHAAVRADAEAMTPADFAARYPVPPAVDQLSYDPLAAVRFAEIDATLDLSDAQRAVVQRHGFAVLDHAAFPTFGEAYEALYALHMPVFISADSLLHAWHRSYDAILKELEMTALISELTSLLNMMHAALTSQRGQGKIPAALDRAASEVDIYLAVARSLLTGTRVAAGDVEAATAVERILADVRGRQPAALRLFGRPDDQPYDYSQFEPRGHYDDPFYLALSWYFQAMMWLGRTEMVLVRYVDGEPRLNRDGVHAALLINALLDESRQRPRWERINLAIERMVGEKDGMDPTDVQTFAASYGLDDLDAVAAAGDDFLQSALLASPYGLQRIMSQILVTDPSQPTLQLPRVFLLLPQRFVIDSWVLHRVTYDRLIDPLSGRKTLRMLPSELDVQFALGSNTAGALLAEEIARFGHQGALHELRFLIDAHPPQFWKANLYNGWLHAIRSLNEELLQPGRPESLRTEAWARKSLETQLGAWAELRHDTILYAKQSYSASAACTYPDAYVEPAPLFFDRMAQLGRLGADMAATLHRAGFRTTAVKSYFDNFRAVMERLRPIAAKELAGEGLADEELAFLRMAIEKEIVGCGETRYDGWYPSLFFKRAAVAELEPTIADVHTAPTDEFANPVGWVLHAATGRPRLMVLTVDGCAGPHAYVGPVSTYHSVLTTQLQRLTDEEWKTQMDRSATTPGWTSTYRR